MGRKITLLIIACCIAACLLTAGCTSRTEYTESGGATPVPTPTATPAPTIQFHPVSPVTPSTTATPTPSVASVSPPEDREQLKILDHDIEYDGYMVYVTGTAKNIGSDRLSHASLKAKFYDCDENLVGNGMDMVSDLDAGETWKFKISTFDLDYEIESYKIGVGSTW